MTAKILRAELIVFLVLIVLIMVPYTLDPAGDAKNLVLHWTALILTATWAVGSYIEKRPFQRPPLFFTLWLLFLGLYVLAALFSSHIGHSFVEVRRFLSLFLIYLAAAQAYRKASQIHLAMIFACIAVAAASVYAIVQRAGLDPFPWADTTLEQYTNLPSTFGNPNVAGHALILALLVSLYLASQPKTRWCILFTPLFCWHLYNTHHRAGLVALAAAALLLAAILAVRRRGVKPRRAVVLSLALLALFALGAALSAMAYSRLARDRSPFSDSSLLLRLNGFYSAARMVADRPLFGHGPGNYVIENPRFWTPYEQRWFDDRRMMNDHVHNEYLEAAIDAGVPAGILFIALLMTGLVRALSMAMGRDGPGTTRLGIFFAVFFCAFAVDALFGFNLRVPVSASLLFLLMGALDGLHVFGRPAETPAPVPYQWRAALVLGALLLAFTGTQSYAAELHLFRSRTLLTSFWYEAAGEELDRADALASWNWRYARHKGMALYRTRNYAEAIGHFEKSLARNPQWIVALIPLADSHLQIALDRATDFARRRPALDNAVRYADRVIALCPPIASAWEIRARAAYARASIAQGEAENMPGGADGETVRAVWRRAETALSEALQRAPKTPGPLHVMLAQTQAVLGDLDGATRTFREAVRVTPDEEAIWVAFYKHESKQGNYEAILDAIEKIIVTRRQTLAPPAQLLAMLYSWRGRIIEVSTGDLDAATKAYLKAVGYGSDEAPVWSRFSAFARRVRRLDVLKRAAIETQRRYRDERLELLPGLEVLATAWDSESSGLASAVDLLHAFLETYDEGRSGVPASVQFGWVADTLLSEFQAANLPDEEGVEPIFRLGKIYAKLGHHAQAAGLFAGVYRALPPARRAEGAQAWANALLDARQGLDTLTEAAHATPEDLDLGIALARAQVARGDTAQARSEYEGLLRAEALADETRLRLEAERDRLPSLTGTAGTRPD